MRLDKVYRVHAECVNALHFLPDGGGMASAAYEWDPEEEELFGVVKVWTSEPAVRAVHKDEHYGGHLAVSPTGDRLAWGGRRGQIRFLRGADGSVQGEVDVPEADDSPIDPILFSPSGDRLFLGLSEGGIHVLDARLNPLAPLPTGPSTCLAVSPEGKRLAVGVPGGRVEVWNLRSSTLQFAFAAHNTGVRSVTFAGEGVLVTSCSDVTSQVHHPARFWELSAGGAVRKAESKFVNINAAAFLRRTNRAVVAGEAGRIELWDVSRYEPIEDYQLDPGDPLTMLFEPDQVVLESKSGTEITSLALAPNEDRLAVGMIDGCVAFMDL